MVNARYGRTILFYFKICCLAVWIYKKSSTLMISKMISFKIKWFSNRHFKWDYTRKNAFEISGYISEIYSVSRETVKKDVGKFILMLITKGIVVSL